ncbi:hypothetical protein [Tepidibacter aestuarii]|uniref:hypothetical protein n=1 Tax=Tepidibacter aestuarii TaxID=2925782 RepID=UPI0020C10C25|nr:hypothetical protein [Tepidibacter aestuarii]CAH2213482.1 conserved protein of unknown function [Tepidibacter aestuarii]
MDIKNILKVLEQRKALHIEDPTVEKFWDKLTELLSENVEETISFFDNCTEEQILWFSEVFEDIAYNFQSVKFIECLDRIFEKYPNIPIEESIKTAKQYMI